MKLGFWSPYNRISGTSSNALAIANELANEKYLKTVIVQLDVNYFDEIVRERKHLSNEAEMLINHIYQKAIDDEYRTKMNMEKGVIHDACITLWCHRLFYLPCYFTDNEHVLIDMLGDMLELLEKHFDCVILDIPSGRSQLSLRALSLADKVMINIPQSKKKLDEYLHDPCIKQDKAYYLIGKYDPNSINSCNNFKRSYAQMKESILGYVLYNTEFGDRCDNNSMVAFFVGNNREYMEEDDTIYTFVTSVSNISQLLYGICDFNKKKIHF